MARQTVARDHSPAKRERRRRLDALAFAEEEVSTTTKIQKNRIKSLGRGSPIAREIAEGSEDEGDSRKAKRVKAEHKVDFEPDSDGQSADEEPQFEVGEVASDNDSSLDSDEAFEDGDEERFRGFAFAGSSGAKSRRRAGEVALTADEARQRITVSEPKRVRDIGATRRVSSELLENEQMALRPKIFNSEVQDDNEASDNEHDSNLSVSDTEDGTEDSAKLARLQELAASLDQANDPATTSRTELDQAQEALTPSKYGIRSRQKLSVADLLPTVTDLQGRKALRMMMDGGRRTRGSKSGVLGRLDVPLAKRKQDCLDRAAAYERSKETLDRWIETVKRNRRTEHLVFPLLDADVTSAKSAHRLPPTFLAKPVTDLEGAIQSILTESGLPNANHPHGDRIEDSESLAANKMPVEEVQARRAELRRNRDLLFREEIRSKRIKKIKSKSYRRVHRQDRDKNILRQNEALTETGMELEGEQEQLDKRRAEERMRGRHRESRWAKSVKGAGRQAWDEGVQTDLIGMARKNEELRKRVQGAATEAADQLSDSASGEEDTSGKDDIDNTSENLRERLTGLKGHDTNEDTSRLGSMKFMQTANAARKAQNDEAIEELQQELSGEDVLNESGSEKRIPGRRRYGPGSITHSVPKATLRPTGEFHELLESDRDDGRKEARAEEPLQGTTSQANRTHRVEVESSSTFSKPSTASSRTKPKSTANPWLSQTKEPNSNRSLAAEKAVVISNNAEPQAVRSLENADLEQVRLPSNHHTKDEDSGSNASDADSSTSSFQRFSPPASPRSNRIGHTLANQDLIRRAFASDDVLAASNFAAEKATLEFEDQEEKDDGMSGSTLNLPGWGSWTGAGLPKRDRRKPSSGTAKKAQKGPATDVQAQTQEPRQDKALANVMISQKRVPKTARYLATALPRPFETRTQYERSLRLPVGREWITGETFRQMVRPRVETKAGEVVPAKSRPTV